MDEIRVEYSDITNMWAVYIDGKCKQFFETYIEAVNYADAVRNLRIEKEHSK